MTSLGCSNVGPSHGRASFTGTTLRAWANAAAQWRRAVLTGFQADAVNPALRYNDSVTIPHDVNGLAAFAGCRRACGFRCWSRMYTAESTRLSVAPGPVPHAPRPGPHKISKEGRDQGRNLDWPEVPKDGDDLEQLAHSFMVRHGLAMYEGCKGRDLRQDWRQGVDCWQRPAAEPD